MSARRRGASPDRILLKLRELAILSRFDLAAIEMILDDALRHRRLERARELADRCRGYAKPARVSIYPLAFALATALF